MEVKKIICTVTNDLNFDQRMIRICSSLQNAGYDVTLVGRKKKGSKPLNSKSFRQHRLFCYFQKGKLFYAEYNIRLFFYLLFVKADLFCAIDLDTILPTLFASKIRSKKRVYDAHELFCEMEEIVSRPAIFKMWKGIEKYAVPQFKYGYTIGECYADEFLSMYGVQYEVVRNATVLQPLQQVDKPAEKYILYQGAVNEGRSFETLIPAMRKVDCKLIICGEGNFFQQALALTEQNQLQHKIVFKGYVEPGLLRQYTRNAYAGITLFTNQGKSNYLSMANRFFDYMHFAVPQLCVAFPEYVKVNQKYPISLLLQNTSEESISVALNKLLSDRQLHLMLSNNCMRAREEYCWQQEELKLIAFYKKIFG
jgi:glycosyltransferase involved in cell wall biosynthesis